MQTSFFLIHLELKRQIRLYTPVVSFLKNHTRLQTKMSRVFTSFRTERGNIRIWPVCKEYHPRPRGLYLIIYTLGVLWLLQKNGATRSQEQRKPQMETFRNTLGGRLEIDRN